jgi:hypothetical protein
MPRRSERIDLLQTVPTLATAKRPYMQHEEVAIPEHLLPMQTALACAFKIVCTRPTRGVADRSGYFRRLGNLGGDKALPQLTSLPPFFEMGEMDRGAGDCQCYDDPADGFEVWCAARPIHAAADRVQHEHAGMMVLDARSRRHSRNPWDRFSATTDVEAVIDGDFATAGCWAPRHGGENRRPVKIKECGQQNEQVRRAPLLPNAAPRRRARRHPRYTRPPRATGL